MKGQKPMLSNAYVVLWRSTRTVAYVSVNAKFEMGWETRYFPAANPEDVSVIRIDGVASQTGDEPALFFSENLGSRDGMDFTLFAEPGHDREAVARAKAYLRHNRDVLQINVIRIDELIHKPAPPALEHP